MAADESGGVPRRAVVVAATVVIGAGLGAAGLAVTADADTRRTPRRTAAPSASAPSVAAAAAAVATRSTSAEPSATPTSTPTRTASASPTAEPTHATPSATPSATATSTPAARTKVAAVTTSAGVVRLFSARSPWNRRIPANPAIDPASDAVSRAVLTNADLVINIAARAYGIPFYTATPATPRVVLGGRGGIGKAIPLDPSWRPNLGGDKKLNIIDPVADLVYELQGYEPSTRSAYWMVVRDLSDGLGDGRASRDRRGPTGSGMTQAGGVIRVQEIRAGRIDHALSFITSRPIREQYRYPATGSDGDGTGDGIAEGMRIQLDPAVRLDAIRGIGKGELAIARALQRYGAYCVDSGGGNNMAMGFYAERPTKASGDHYDAAGLHGDWIQLPHIPRGSLRVLAASVTRP